MGDIFCVEIIRDKNGNPIYYTLYNESNKEYKQIKKEELKLKMKKDLKVKNLILTSDNKIREIELKKNTITLYHGSPKEFFELDYTKGEDKHDYGRGFYLTPSIELAKEWAVCNIETDGFLHEYEVDLTGLKILDFDKENVLAWIAELMSHRDADSSMSYLQNSKIFIKKYKINTEGYDIIKGWRADASYFYIAKQFVRNEVDISILNELLKKGDLGIQYCLKSEKAFRQTKEIRDGLIVVPMDTYKEKYVNRDKKAREDMRALIASERNIMGTRFIDLIRG